MPNEKGHLYLFEAVELRNEFDRHVKLLKHVLDEDRGKSNSFLRSSEDELKEAAADFHPKELEDELKKIQTKRVALNQAIQEANFTQRISYDGKEISIAEALEVRKSLLADLDLMTDKIRNSAYKRIIHKEERDIVHEPKHSFPEVYDEFKKKIAELRDLVNKIHLANHTNEVRFREE